MEDGKQVGNEKARGLRVVRQIRTREDRSRDGDGTRGDGPSLLLLRGLGHGIVGTRHRYFRFPSKDSTAIEEALA